MQISNAQMDTLAFRHEAAFLQRALRYLVDKHVDLVQRVGVPRVEAILQSCLQRCRLHEAASESCVLILADLSLTRARDVYVTDGYVQEILASGDIDTAAKAQRLKGYL